MRVDDIGLAEQGNISIDRVFKRVMDGISWSGIAMWWSRRDLNPSANIENLSKIKGSGFWNMSQYDRFRAFCLSERQTRLRMQPAI